MGRAALIAGFAGAYMFIGGFVGRLVFETARANHFGDPAGLSLFAGVLWPFIGPILWGAQLGKRYWAWLTAPKRVANALRKDAWPTGPEAP